MQSVVPRRERTNIFWHHVQIFGREDVAVVGGSRCCNIVITKYHNNADNKKKNSNPTVTTIKKVLKLYGDDCECIPQGYIGK